jgi:hypothetical protein
MHDHLRPFRERVTFSSYARLVPMTFPKEIKGKPSLPMMS